jgi:hypothetical protein
MIECCEYGKCTNAINCPVRQARREAANKAYAQQGMVVDTDPYTDTLGTVKALVSVIVVCIVVTLLAYAIWGK